MTDADAPPPQTEAPRRPEPPPQQRDRPPSRLPLPAILIVAAILLVAGVAYFVTRTHAIDPALSAYTVQPYTPPSELITASERVVAHVTPDAVSPPVVMFGQGVTLNVTGRVSRGLGGEWYAIAWNDHVAFVRQQDAVAGHGAPPVAEEHPVEQPRPPEKPDVFDVPDEEDVGTAPPPTSEGREIGAIDWIRAPSSRDFAHYYPHRALDQGRSGRVVLDCTARGNGALDCSVAQENPSGMGFGDAAISISRQLRIRPTRPDGSSVAGGHLRLPLTFQAD
jgi:TonB family protein